jgi:glycosyltransferase involved in cell wall biosynthesis
LDYLAITISGHTAINRRLFEELAETGKMVSHVFPSALPFNGTMLPCDDNSNTLVQNIPTEYKGANPRTSKFIGLNKIIQELQPKYIFAEFDPASCLMVQITRKFGKQIKIICLSCENLSITPKANAQREGIKGFVFGIVKTILAKLTLPNLHHCFVLSNDGLQVFKQLGYKKISISHIGFDEKIFFKTDEKREKYRNELQLQYTTIAYFGRIIPEKGLHILIEALAKIKDLQWHFLMDSFARYETDYIKQINALIKENYLEDRLVTFDANHFEICNYMNASDICVIPSLTTNKWKEQFGRVAPESMACGNAIIVSNSGTLKEIVGNAGFVFNEKNVQELVSFLQQLLTDENALNEQKRKSIERAKSYSLKAQVADLLAIK